MGFLFQWVPLPMGFLFQWGSSSNGFLFQWFSFPMVFSSNGFLFRWVFSSNGFLFQWGSSSNGFLFRCWFFWQRKYSDLKPAFGLKQWQAAQAVVPTTQYFVGTRCSPLFHAKRCLHDDFFLRHTGKCWNLSRKTFKHSTIFAWLWWSRTNSRSRRRVWESWRSSWRTTPRTSRPILRPSSIGCIGGDWKLSTEESHDLNKNRKKSRDSASPLMEVPLMDVFLHWSVFCDKFPAVNLFSAVTVHTFSVSFRFFLHLDFFHFGMDLTVQVFCQVLEFKVQPRLRLLSRSAGMCRPVSSCTMPVLIMTGNSLQWFSKSLWLRSKKSTKKYYLQFSKILPHSSFVWSSIGKILFSLPHCHSINQSIYHSHSAVNKHKC